MITYQKLQGHPQVAPSLIGMSIPAFDKLYSAFAVSHQIRLSTNPVTKRQGKVRQRATGAGAPHRYDLKERLLMTLFWLRVYTTYAVLGFFYDLNATNVEDNLKDVLATLATMSDFTREHAPAERVKLRSPQAVMDAFPDVRLVIDAKEQRIQRPSATTDANGQAQDNQKPYYSGKKKTHTLKTQLAVAPDGTIEAVSASVPGGATHDLTLLRHTKLLDGLAPDEAAMLDKGYDGIRNDYPDHPIYHPHKARRNHPLSAEQKAENRHLAKYRIIVEHTIAQLNKFQSLAQVFRHQLTLHTTLMRVIAALVNRQFQVTPLKRYLTA